jgi:RND family efflux transporter MFP subunit
MKDRKLILNSLIPVLATALSVGCGHDQPRQAEAALDPVNVEIAEVELIQEEKAIELRGVVQPGRQAAISSRVMGPVVALKTRAGATVAKDQVLLEIQPEAAEGQLAQARGALAQAEAAFALAERNFARYEALSKENAASDVELDMARMQFEQAKGAVEQAEGAVQAASSVAEESVVRSPFAARVVETMVEVGDFAAPGRPLVRVESIGGQQIWLKVRERDIGRVAIGDEIGVRIDARPELSLITGTIDEIVPAADPTTHTFTIKVGLDGLAIPSGFSGRATISGDSSQRLVVDSSAVHHRGGLELVVIRSGDGTARTRAVTTGGSTIDGRVEILSGLDRGETVVLNAAGPVADGTPLELDR